MSVSCASFCSYQVIPAVTLINVRRFGKASFRRSISQPHRGSDELFLLRTVFLQYDGPFGLMARPEIPLLVTDPFSAVVIMEQGCVKSAGIDIDRLTPRTVDTVGPDQEIVHIKLQTIRVIYIGIKYIKAFFNLAPGQARSPYSF